MSFGCFIDSLKFALGKGSLPLPPIGQRLITPIVVLKYLNILGYTSLRPLMLGFAFIVSIVRVRMV